MLRKKFTPSKDFITQVTQGVNIENNKNIWIISRYMEILGLLAPKKFLQNFKKIFSRDYPEERILKADAIFLRAGLIEAINYIEDLQAFDLETVNNIVHKDKSDYVKQTWCKFLAKDKYKGSWEDTIKLLSSNNEAPVKASVILAMTEIAKNSGRAEEYCEILKGLAPVDNLFLARVVLRSGLDLLRSQKNEALAKDLATRLSQITTKLMQDDCLLSIKRVAAVTNLEIWALSDRRRSAIQYRLEDIVTNTEVGKTKEIKDEEINALPLEEIGKILCTIAKNDFDIEFWRQGNAYIICRGVRMKFRLWRLIYEFFSPSPDKRQDISHSIGRVYHGRNLVMSNVAELSKTQVPGEPMFIEEEQGPRTFLPLADYCLSVMDSRAQSRIFSPEGVTIVTPPAGLLKRFFSSLQFSLRFKNIAGFRNWHKDDFWRPDQYVKKLEEYGIGVNFEEYKGVKASKETRAFFKSLAVVPFFGDINFTGHLLASHKNSLAPLGLFILIVLAVVGFKHLRSYRGHVENRSKIPLVLGGWGTRGKTGAERLKASLFNSMGLGLISKTTGCEASMIMAEPYGRMYELPLFRANMQTSIAEQKDVANFASKLGADVFLWECMALRGPYVNILQSEWMEDEISTITNAHPDHEDIQGPTGVDVAHSISNFIRKGGEVLTAEEQMLPIFKDKARREGAEIGVSDWLESGLISKEILDLFSYYEHPNNIALILKLAEKLGMGRSFALKSMIDNVLPDIGALKAFQECELDGRKLQLINGMSANEEIGTINNWQRLGFDKYSVNEHVGTSISVIVNNRHDRVRRSRVFAHLFAQNLIADKYFLIGTNLKGFQQYLLKDFNSYVNNLIKLMKESKEPLALYEKALAKLRICVEPAVKDKILSFIPDSTKEEDIRVKESLRQSLAQNYQDYIKIKQAITVGKIPAKEIESSLGRVFLSRIVILPEGDISPDEIMNKIVEATPNGFTNRIMAVQNIKAPGINLVRAWEQWENCYKAGLDLNSGDDRKIARALEVLGGYKSFNILSKGYVQKLVTGLPKSEPIQKLTVPLKKIIGATNLSSIELLNQAKQNKLVRGVYKTMVDLFEKMINKQMTERIYEDLANKRISVAKAQSQLQQINQAESRDVEVVAGS